MAPITPAAKRPSGANGTPASALDGAREGRVLSDSEEAQRAAFRRASRRLSSRSILGAKPVPPGTEPLTEEIRRATKEAHRRSDLLINAKLALALGDKEGVSYARALRLFFPIYLNLEKLQRLHKNHPMVSKLPFRSSTQDGLMMDLMFFKITPNYDHDDELKMAAEYAFHIEKVAEDCPELLCVYVYTMQMALLAGGQIIKRLVQRALPITASGAGGGLAIFELEPGEGTANAVRDAFRAAMNDIGASTDVQTRARMVAEAVAVYQWNNRLVSTLHVRWRHVILGWLTRWHGAPLLLLLLPVLLAVLVKVYVAFVADVM